MSVLTAPEVPAVLSAAFAGIELGACLREVGVSLHVAQAARPNHELPQMRMCVTGPILTWEDNIPEGR